MFKLRLSVWLRYGMALASVLLATLVREMLDPILGGNLPFITYFPAVMFSAWACGLGPALVATGLSTVAAAYFFIPPDYSLAVTGTPELLGLGLFLVVGIVTALMSESLHRSNRRVEETTAALSASERRLATTLGSIGDAVMATDAEGRISFMNAVAQELTGWTFEQARGREVKEVFKIVNETTREEVESPVEKVFRHGNIVGLANHTLLIRRDGVEVPIDDSGAPIKDSDGSISGVVLVFRDITERRRAEEIHSRFAAIVESTDDAIFGKTLDGVIMSWNEGAQKLYGYSAEEITGRHVSVLVPPGLTDEVTQILAGLKRGEHVEHLESVRVRKDGSLINVALTISPIRNAEGRIVGASTIARNITERRRVEEALRASEERYRAFVENSSEAIWRFELEEPVPIGLPEEEQIELFYRHGYLAECNDAMAQMYGLGRAAEIVGARLGDLLIRDNPNNVELLRSFIRSGYRLTEAESAEADRAGNQKYFLNNLVGSVEAGSLRRAWGTQRDITEHRSADEARARALEREQAARLEAEQANRTKDEFLATLSHELRTPLTAVLGWTTMLRTMELDEATASHALETVERNARAQAQLIEDLLDVSRIITGNLRLDVRPVELVPVVRAAMDAVRPAADARGIRLETSFDPLAGMVSGDPARLQQVVWNLLSNAVRFTSRGGQVKVSLQSVDAQAEITVSDTGQGINPEFLPYVFDRFRQADSSMTRSHGGLGLGLAIVRHLVELHGGTVEAESEGQGRGASFRISLPLMPAPPATAQTAPAETGEPSRMRQLASLEGLRVLIVDDEPDARDLIKTVLETCGAAVTAVASASEALAALEQFRPDVLISDIGLPGTDGYALIKQVRALKAEQGGGVPAAALSAYVGEENRRMALDAGFQLYVAKPVDPAELVAVVERLSKDGKG